MSNNNNNFNNNMNNNMNNNLNSRNSSNNINDVSNPLDYSVNSYKSLILIVILGYFSVKVIDKVMGETKDCGEGLKLIRNSQYDFMSLLVFGTFIYLFNTYLVDIQLTSSYGFMIFYIIGLSFGILYSRAKKQLKEDSDSTLLNILMGLFYVLSLVVVLFSLIAGASTPSRLIIYIVFLVGFLGIAYYLNTFNKKYRDLEKKENIYIFSDKLVLTVPMVSLLINLLFIRGDETSNLSSIILKLMSGLFLGVFVSSLAVFGVSSLIPQPTQVSCDEKQSCKMKPVNEYDIINLYKSSKLANATLIILIIVLVILGLVAGGNGILEGYRNYFN